MFRSEKDVIEQVIRGDKHHLQRAKQRVIRLTEELRGVKNAVEHYQKCIEKNQRILDLEAAESEETQASVKNWESLGRTGRIENIRTQLRWGTFGKSGKDPLKYVLLCDLSTAHIEAILATQTHIGDAVTRVLYMELGYRAVETRRLENALAEIAAGR